MGTTVITPEVIQELPLEKVIDQTLTKNNVTNKVIAALKAKYGGMVLKDVNDKEGYVNIREARKEVRKIGILAEKLCKEGRDDANKIRALWIDKEKEVLGKIAEIQDPLDDEIKKYDDEQARLEAEELQRQEERFMTRQSQLLKMGAVYANGCFNLNDVSYESNMIKEADGEIYSDTILPKYTAAYEKNEAIRVAEEKKKEAEAIELKRQQDEFVEKQKQFNEQQEQFKQQQAELQKQKDEADRKERERVAEEKRIKMDADNHRWRSRLALLDEIGWNGQFAYSKISTSETQVFTYDELVELSEESFNIRMKEYNSSTALFKKELADKAEEKRLADIETAKQEAIIKEQERAAEEQRQLKIKAEQDEVKRLEELSKASDKEKWETLMLEVNAIVLPEFKSGIYKGKLNALKQKIQEINSL